MNSVAKAIVQSLKEGKWLSIDYRSVNKKDAITTYWIAIDDIDLRTRKLHCDIYNAHYSLETENAWIPYDRIIKADVLWLSTMDVSPALLAKIESDRAAASWLHYDSFDNNILYYLAECARLDSDPYIKDYSMVTGIDAEVLKKKKALPLSPEQIKAFVELIFHNDLELYETKCDELALSILSIDQGNKKYVVAYQNVCLDPKSKSLRIVGSVRINSTFLIDGARHSLSYYTELNSTEFRDLLLEDLQKASALLAEGKRPNEKIDTRPDFLLLERQVAVNLAPLFDKLAEKWERKELNTPVRAFFGDIGISDNGHSIPDVVLYDRRVTIDQMLVIYNALKNPVTYVQGPPGTGKTQTLFNVLVSAYFKNIKVLVSTNNNKPLDGIVQKLVFNYKYGPIPFPYLRLGNVDAVKEATARIDRLANANFPGTVDEMKIGKIKQVSKERGRALT